MRIYVNNLLAVSLTIFCSRLLHTHKEDNFVDLQVFYETENSKLIVILKSRG